MKKDSNFIHLNDYFRIYPNFFKIILLIYLDKIDLITIYG